MTDTAQQKGSSKTAYIAAGIVTAAILLFIYFNYNRESFKLEDFYIDSSGAGKYVFLFVDTRSNDRAGLLNWALEMKKNGGLMEMPDKATPCFLTVHFYNRSDTAQITKEMTDKLLRQYPAKPDLVKKIDFVPRGHIYYGHNMKTLEGLPADTLFDSDVLIPKPGYKAKDILKNKEIKKQKND